MAKTIPVSSGIDGIPVHTIPEDPREFTNWFKSNFIPRWLGPADVRNAVEGSGITITSTGQNASPTVSVNPLTLQYLAPYTNAVQETLTAKLSQVVSVKDF